MAHTMSRIRRLERIEGLAAQRQRQGELEDLEALAESARMRIVHYLEARRNGESLPVLEPAVRHDGPHHEALRRRLSTMRERLERYATLRDTHGIQ
jgi:hypothetical protein